jgi:hypothetical protein
VEEGKDEKEGREGNRNPREREIGMGGEGTELD